MGQFLDGDAGTRGLLRNPSPKAANILGELTVNQVAAVAAEIMLPGSNRWQDGGIFFPCGEPWTLGEQAIFVPVPEKKFA